MAPLLGNFKLKQHQHRDPARLIRFSWTFYLETNSTRNELIFANVSVIFSFSQFSASCIPILLALCYSQPVSRQSARGIVQEISIKKYLSPILINMLITHGNSYIQRFIQQLSVFSCSFSFLLIRPTTDRLAGWRAAGRAT